MVPLRLGLHSSLDIKEMITNNRSSPFSSPKRLPGPQLSERVDVGEQGGAHGPKRHFTKAEKLAYKKKKKTLTGKEED